MKSAESIADAIVKHLRGGGVTAERARLREVILHELGEHGERCVTEEYLEAQNHLSMVAGERVAFERAADILKDAASKAFVMGADRDAMLLRHHAQQIEALAKGEVRRAR